MAKVNVTIECDNEDENYLARDVYMKFLRTEFTEIEEGDLWLSFIEGKKDGNTYKIEFTFE